MGDFLQIVGGTALGISAVVLLYKFWMSMITIFEYETGVAYSWGRFKGILPPRLYFYWPVKTMIKKVDLRRRTITLKGQEILCSDGTALKITLAASYRVADPAKVLNQVQDYESSFYTELQLALRRAVGSRTIEDLLANREEVSKAVGGQARPVVEEMGLNLVSVELKDIMLPGKLKEVFSQVLKAREEGKAVLEKARGESAALRSLANAARMMESNPVLMQLRLIHALGTSSGNTLVLTMDRDGKSVPVKTVKKKKAEKKEGKG